MSKDTESQAPLNMEVEEDRELVRTYEGNLLGGLLAAANYQTDETYTIDVIRKGVKFFSFRIRPLSEDEFQKLLKRYTKYGKNRRLGGKVQEDFDRSGYRSDVIFTATVPEDRQTVWGDNNGLWRALDVLSGPQAIAKVLKAGEMERIYERIEEISGYTDEDAEAEVETAKN